jgi:hypothetical protein
MKSDVYCGVVVNGVELDQPHCRTVEECVKQILEDYKNEVKRMREPPPPPPPDPAEELLRSGLSWGHSALIGLGSGWTLGRGWWRLPKLCADSRGWWM